MAVTVTNSTTLTGAVQADGRVRTHETHLLSDGREFTFDYDREPGTDPDAVLTARAARINAEMAAREAADIEAANGEIPLTKYQFRQRFTHTERMAIDAFNATFEANGDLTAEQKGAIRTALADLDASQAVSLTNTSTIAGVQMYEALELLAEGRAAEILNG